MRGTARKGRPALFLFERIFRNGENDAMNNELDTILRTLERDRGIGRQAMLATIASALQAAAKKSLLTSNDVRVEIDPASLEIKAWERRLVDDSVLGTAYISLADARRFKPDAQIGDTIETPVSPRVFGRIAAQTAKQVVVQRIREAERNMIYEDYVDRQGEVVTGIIQRISGGTVYMNILHAAGAARSEMGGCGDCEFSGCCRRRLADRRGGCGVSSARMQKGARDPAVRLHGEPCGRARDLRLDPAEMRRRGRQCGRGRQRNAGQCL